MPATNHNTHDFTSGRITATSPSSASGQTESNWKRFEGEEGGPNQRPSESSHTHPDQRKRMVEELAEWSLGDSEKRYS